MSQSLIHQKLISIMRKVRPVGKGRKNDTQNYSFRGIDDVSNELHSLFSEEGVIITSELVDLMREERTSKGGGALTISIAKVKYTFWAEDGSFVSCLVAGEGMDYGDKSVNKCMSVSLKYALMQMFLIPTAEKKDPENEDPEPLSKEEQRKRQCVIEINAATDIETLSVIKDKYRDILAMPDKEVYNLSIEKYKSLRLLLTK